MRSSRSREPLGELIMNDSSNDDTKSRSGQRLSAVKQALDFGHQNDETPKINVPEAPQES